MPSESLIKLLRALHIEPDPAFIDDVEYLAAVADEIFGLVTPEGPAPFTLLGLRGDGRGMQAVFFDPTFEGHGQGNKTGRVIFKGEPLPSPLHGTYRIEVKRVMKPVTLCMAKVYKEGDPKHHTVWSGLGHGEELLGNWYITF